MVGANLKILVNDAAAMSTAKASKTEMEVFLGKNLSQEELDTAFERAFKTFKRCGKSEEEAFDLAQAVTYGAQERRTSLMQGMLNACQQLNANKDK